MIFSFSVTLVRDLLDPTVSSISLFDDPYDPLFCISLLIDVRGNFILTMIRYRCYSAIEWSHGYIDIYVGRSQLSFWYRLLIHLSIMVRDLKVPRLNRYIHWSTSDILVILTDDPLIDSGPWPTGLAVRSISLLICQIYSFDLDCILSSRCYSAIKMILRLDRFICWSVSDIFMILTDDPFFDYGPWPNGLAVKSNLCRSMSAINSFNLNWSVCCPRWYSAIKMILRLDRYLSWSTSAIFDYLCNWSMLS